jgi:hypothetical protein
MMIGVNNKNIWGKFPFGHKKTYTSLLATQKIELSF